MKHEDPLDPAFGAKKVSPPYVSYLTLKNTLAGFHKNLPAQIDRSVLRGLSGASQSALLSSMTFLGLIKDDGAPTDALKALVAGQEDAKKAALKKILEARFPKAIHQLTNNGTPHSLKNNFDYEGPENVMQKTRSLVIALAKEAGFSISSHIASETRARSGPRKARAAASKPRSLKNAEENGGAGAPTPPTEAALKPGEIKLPMTLNPTKIWHVVISETYTDDEIDRFTQMIQLSLKKGKK